MCRGALQRDLSCCVICALCIPDGLAGPRPPRREGSASRSCRGRLLVPPPCPELRRALPRFVRRAFCVPVAFTGGSDVSCREARHPAPFTFDLQTSAEFKARTSGAEKRKSQNPHA